MAVTSYGTNHPMAVKHWSEKLMREALKETFVRRFMGTSKDSIIYIKDQPGKGAGDKVTFGLRMQLSQAGIQGDATLEGNEEALVVHTDSLMINQVRNAVRSGGKMSEQRVPFSVREEAKDALKDWVVDVMDRSFFAQLGGVGTSDAIYAGNNTITSADANHRVFGGSQNTSTTASLTISWTGNQLLLSNLDACVEIAKTSTNAIRPIKTDGGQYYVCFVHPYQATDLRRNAGTMGWATIQSYRVQGGQGLDNPIFKGGSFLGIYNGVAIHESTRVPSPTAKVYNAVFAGAQAGCAAFGKESGPNKFSWVEELFDYKNQLGVAAGFTWGIKKTRYNSEDYGVITLSTNAQAHAQ